MINNKPNSFKEKELKVYPFSFIIIKYKTFLKHPLHTSYSLASQFCKMCLKRNTYFPHLEAP